MKERVKGVCVLIRLNMVIIFLHAYESLHLP